MLNDASLALMQEINKKFGPESVVLGSDMRVSHRFTSGSLALDVALGGGFPANLWTGITGHHSAGKTAVALKTIAANQVIDPDYTTFWLAAEKYDEQQATALGVDNDRVMVAPTQDMELAFSLILAATEGQAATCIVLDSYPALVAKEEDEKRMDEFTTAAGAKRMGQFIRKLGKASKRSPLGTDPAFHGILINQYRDKVGAWTPNKFAGTPQFEPGGAAPGYFFYVKLEVARKEYITEKRPGIEKPVKVGQMIQFKTLKNKSAAPQQVAYSDFYFRGAPTMGFRRGDYDTAKETLAMAKLFGVIQNKPRSGFHYYGENTWKSKDEAELDIRADIGLQRALRESVLDAARDDKLVDQIQPEQVEAANGSNKPKRAVKRRVKASRG